MSPLPPDLERLILEMEAFDVVDSNPGALVPLFLVARRTHIWLEPILYRTLHFIDTRQRFRLLVAASLKSPAFLAQSVRSVLLGSGMMAASHYCEILRYCTSLRSLTVQDWRRFATCMPLLMELRIERFSGYFTMLLSILAPDESDFDDEAVFTVLKPANHPLLCHLTHLFICEQLSAPQHPDLFEALARLPALTHLALCLGYELSAPEAGVLRILDTCTHLRALVLGYEAWLGAMAISPGEFPESWRAPKYAAKILVYTVEEEWLDAFIKEASTFWDGVDAFLAGHRTENSRLSRITAAK
ncbi:Zn(2)-C6 fungal-type domain-containing protein [Mycena kentingensis (nom. inval.)]|nr:Zn(2)-C6 fungal-type domain-containing protein [Mycena kentingensis (nom. inval.)]